MWMMLRIFANDLGVTRYEMLVDNCGPLDKTNSVAAEFVPYQTDAGLI